jgi:hypothetical protein
VPLDVLDSTGSFMSTCFLHLTQYPCVTILTSLWFDKILRNYPLLNLYISLHHLKVLTRLLKAVNLSKSMKYFSKQCALKCILILSIAGLLFSGYLSYTELFTSFPAFCSSQTCSQQIASIPVCVYGFLMYLAIFIISLIGLKSKK